MPALGTSTAQTCGVMDLDIALCPAAARPWLQPVLDKAPEVSHARRYRSRLYPPSAIPCSPNAWSAARVGRADTPLAHESSMLSQDRYGASACGLPSEN